MAGGAACKDAGPFLLNRQLVALRPARRPNRHRIADKGKSMTGIPQDATVADSAPTSDGLTADDRSHMLVYIRLLDAAEEGASWEEVCSILFGLDATSEPERARQTYDSHMRRAQWFSRQGYRHLLDQ
jgi:hypothetical protein